MKIDDITIGNPYRLIDTDTELYDIYYTIATTIFKYRMDNKLTMKQLAVKLGVTQSMGAKLESGDYNYTVRQLSDVAGKLGLKFSITLVEKLGGGE